MTERPIIFKSPMVRAILDGRKTVTRRPVEPQPHSVGDQFSTQQHDWPMIRKPGEQKWTPVVCPYGQSGDLFWVREKWRVESWHEFPDGIPVTRWRPSTHMPRWAARLWLRVLDVRVERLKEIDEAGVTAEGFGARDVPGGRDYGRGAFMETWDEIYGDWAANPWVWVVAFQRCEAPA